MKERRRKLSGGICAQRDGLQEERTRLIYSWGWEELVVYLSTSNQHG
jgi:hypothetical protein